MIRIYWCLVLGMVIGNLPASQLAILPSEISLDGPEARQQLIAVRMSEGESLGEVSDVVYTSSNPTVVAVEEGVLVARGNGVAQIVAKHSGKEVSVNVEVTGYDKSWEWSFSNHVLPVMSKAGCNSGGCHGALAGKGGFRLSLQAYSPADDYHTITREALGRRIELADPGRSLFLTKPTAAVKHKGGKLIETGSRDYQVLAEWIASGAPKPQANDPGVERLEVLPEISSLKPGDQHQLLVRAHYTDGRIEDVTQWAQYTSANEVVAQVEEDGKVEVVGYGEGAVTVWFSSKIVMARITAPFDNQIPEAIFTNAPKRNLVDELVLAQLQRLNLPPSPAADDSVFIRRAYLDTIGVLPTPKEVREFLADTNQDKRDRLIEHLLARAEYVDYWTYKWSDMLLVNGRLLRPEAVKAYYMWIRERVKENAGWDEFARQIVTAKGGSLENGATNFFAVHQDPETMAENVSQAFLSLSINCAKCHNHPLEKWTNDQYYAFANLFARVRGKGWGGGSRNGDGLRTLYVASRGDLIQPNTGKAQPPAPLDGEPLPFEAEDDRREYLAEWLTSPENPYFSRAIVNRVWANFFGVGLVEQVDDLRVSNPASNEKLLSAMAEHLVEQDYDLKALMRLILRSATYQRSSEPLPENADENRFYSRYYPRRLMAEVLHDAVVDVSNVPTEFTQVAFPGGDKQKTDFYEKGTRALQLYDSAIESYFLKTFGRNERDITCECERSNQPSMVQVLHLSNGTTINEKLSAKESRIEELMKAGMSDESLIEEAYLLCLSRFPTEREKKAFVSLLAGASVEEKRESVEDLFWSLMTSREFLFQH